MEVIIDYMLFQFAMHSGLWNVVHKLNTCKRNVGQHDGLSVAPSLNIVVTHQLVATEPPNYIYIQSRSGKVITAACLKLSVYEGSQINELSGLSLKGVPFNIYKLTPHLSSPKPTMASTVLCLAFSVWEIRFDCLSPSKGTNSNFRQRAAYLLSRTRN